MGYGTSICFHLIGGELVKNSSSQLRRGIGSDERTVRVGFTGSLASQENESLLCQTEVEQYLAKVTMDDAPQRDRLSPVIRPRQCCKGRGELPSSDEVLSTVPTPRLSAM